MYSNKQAFTLIELLVVVLIIGILAAVAVPQYQRTILKTQMLQAFVYGKLYVAAQNMYYLANGTFTSDQKDLDIGLDVPEGWRMALLSSGGLSLTHIASGILFNFWPAYSLYGPENRGYCIVTASSPKLITAKAVCQSLIGTEMSYSSADARFQTYVAW